ncbi:MAG: DUF4434 domain-containing protein [Capnocytophaga sp.]|nr:DUF4434 domain-containing protein [Capnocytophaga sp.]
MKKLGLLFCLIVFAIACKKNEENLTEKNEEKTISSPLDKEILTGTFIQLFGKNDWTELQWDNFFSEIKELGMNTLIVQYTAFKNSYNDITWFDSANTFTAQKSKNTLSRLLSVAQQKGIEVHIGLYFDETYWQNQTNEEWLRLHAQHCIAIAQEINTQFGKNSAFKGWYIPHEPEPYAYNSDEKMKLFRDKFINTISDALHQWSDKPVSIAAFWNSSLSSPKQLQHFMAELSKSNLQIIMLQDGVGAGHVNLEQLAEYYQSAEKGIFIENPNYKGVFWTDLETFAYTPNPPFPPADFERVKQQLSIELSIPKVSKAVSFHYYDDMSSWSPSQAQANLLREKYKIMVKQKMENKN